MVSSDVETTIQVKLHMKRILKSILVWITAFAVCTLMGHLLLMNALLIGIYIDGGFYKFLWFIAALMFTLYVGNMAFHCIGCCVDKQEIIGHKIIFS